MTERRGGDEMGVISLVSVCTIICSLLHLKHNLRDFDICFEKASSRLFVYRGRIRILLSRLHEICIVFRENRNLTSLSNDCNVHLCPEKCLSLECFVICA